MLVTLLPAATVNLKPNSQQLEGLIQAFDFVRLNRAELVEVFGALELVAT